jgi:hypothetical protein
MYFAAVVALAFVAHGAEAALLNCTDEQQKTAGYLYNGVTLVKCVGGVDATAAFEEKVVGEKNHYNMLLLTV